MGKKTVFIQSKLWEQGDPLHKICLFFAHNDEPFWAPPSTRGSRVSHWGLSVGSIPGKTHQRHVVSMLFPQKSPMCQHVGSVTRPQSAFGDDQNNCFFSRWGFLNGARSVGFVVLHQWKSWRSVQVFLTQVSCKGLDVWSRGSRKRGREAQGEHFEGVYRILFNTHYWTVAMCIYK